MLRKLVSGMAALGVVALLVGCSDDDKPKPDLYQPPDAGVDSTVDAATPDMAQDMAPTEASVDTTPQEASVDAGVDTGPKYAVLAGMAEFVGNSFGPDAGTVRLLMPLSGVERPDPVIKPDFANGAAPPRCIGYKWTATTLPNRSAWDAGKLTITGHATSLYVDGDNPATPAPLPATIECTRTAMPGSTTLFTYDCGLPQKTVLPVSSAFTSTTKLTVGATGGADVPAFSWPNLAVGEAPTVTTDLSALDPSAGITIQWNGSVAAALVVIVMRASLADGSESAEITCSQLAVLGQQVIPAGALALLPTPGATNPLVIQTFVAGLAVGGKSETWGTYTVGAGQGPWGATCRLASGLCP